MNNFFLLFYLVVEVAGKKGNTKPVLDPVVVDGKLLPPNKPAPSGLKKMD